MSPLMLVAVSMAAFAGLVPKTVESFSQARPVFLHHLFAPGRDSPSRRRQFAIVSHLLRSLPFPPNSNPPPGLPPPAPDRNPTKRLRPTNALVVSYDGSAFPGGYEYNPKLDAPTVQGVVLGRIVKALGLDVDESSSLGGTAHLSTAGRTDALVSAKAALMTLRTEEDLPESFVEDMNSMSSGGDVVVVSSTPVHASFHASFGTTAREYIYVLPLLTNGAVLDDEEGNHRVYKCDEEYIVRIARAADALLSNVVGEQLDYVGMMSGKVKTQTTLCTFLDAGCWHYDIEGRLLAGGGEGASPGFGECWKEACQDQHSNDASVSNEDFPGWSGCLVFRIKSNRFLRRMMRKVVNSLLQEATAVVENNMDQVVSEKDWKGKWRRRVESMDRSGNTPAPSQGLCFWRVEVE